MGRRAATAEEKIRKELEKLGIDPNLMANVQRGTTHAASRNAEATAEFYEKPGKFRKKTCKTCHEVFFVDYPAVAFCTDRCRKTHLASIGIDWDPTKPTAERWAPARIPLVVPPEAVKVLLTLAHAQSDGVLSQ